MSEIKPCPLCGAMPTKLNSGYTCSTLGCALQENTVSAKDWNIRPIEDALKARIAELETERRWIPVSERLPDGGHREFYEVACIYQYFGELALFSKGRWVIYEGENEYDVSDSVMFWRKRQYLPDEVIAILSKGKMKPEVQE